MALHLRALCILHALHAKPRAAGEHFKYNYPPGCGPAAGGPAMARATESETVKLMIMELGKQDVDTTSLIRGAFRCFQQTDISGC